MEIIIQVVLNAKPSLIMSSFKFNLLSTNVRYIDTYVISEKAECPIYIDGLSLLLSSSLDSLFASINFENIGTIQ